MSIFKKLLILILFINITTLAEADDGSHLWLRMSEQQKAIVKAPSGSKTIAIAKKELQKAWKGGPVALIKQTGTNEDSTEYKISNDNGKITISSYSDAGILYGAYNLLRLQETGEELNNIKISDKPFYDLRILNHWDNSNGSIERGYAGKSLWLWNELPNKISPKYEEYARANASIGINGIVLNNVNASPYILTTENIKKIKTLADIFRPYCIKVYLAVNFASPIILGDIKTADPMNDSVIGWWQKKIKEIYSYIPDFGGFLVKASCEGQPGPADYGRTHAEGANMLADAIKPYKGIIMWRAFVYGNNDSDRIKQCVDEFKPLDGKFHDNVIIQIKNGPLDFQPREPYNPLFDNMPHTKMMVEFQITQEYLGQSTHLAYLAPLWKEFYSFVSPSNLKAVAGVSNVGDSTNWCGHPFAQSNWYAFGRMAWNTRLTSDEIADEWLRQTFTNDTAFIHPVKRMMLGSREAIVNYMMPLGLHHIFKANHHYGPEPWGNQKSFPITWRPVYYHKADTLGIGFNRTDRGTNAVSQYRVPYNALYNNLDSCPEEYLLWFHHVAWTYKLHDGQTLWNELCHKYETGVNTVIRYNQLWNNMKPYIDSDRYRNVSNKLKQQLINAVKWKESCLLYFQTFSRMPFPQDIVSPSHTLKEYLR